MLRTRLDAVWSIVGQLALFKGCGDIYRALLLDSRHPTKQQSLSTIIRRDVPQTGKSENCKRNALLNSLSLAKFASDLFKAERLSSYRKLAHHIGGLGKLIPRLELGFAGSLLVVLVLKLKLVQPLMLAGPLCSVAEAQKTKTTTLTIFAAASLKNAGLECIAETF